MQVLELEPRHLSAKLLLAIADGKQPKTLSATATYYYASLAVRNMMAMVNERAGSRDAHQVPSAVVRSGLIDLRKLRPKADPNVRPLIDAWVKYIVTCNDWLEGETSAQELETQRQLLIDEMTKENTDAELMQKQVREGI